MILEISVLSMKAKLSMLIEMVKAMMTFMLSCQKVENSKVKAIIDVDDIGGVNQSLLCRDAPCLIPLLCPHHTH